MYGGLFMHMHQQMGVAEAQRSAQSAKNRAGRAESRLIAMDEKIERLSLACQALWELLRDSTEITEEDILNTMSEIDIRDGVADGKITTVVLLCPGCGRRGNSKRTTCLYCGHELDKDNVFE